MSAARRMPALFLSHGAGPCFFMNGGSGPFASFSSSSPAAHWYRSLASSLGLTAKFNGGGGSEQQAASFGAPNAIVVLSAHWETDGEIRVTNQKQHTQLLYDYYGFPPETYKLKYNPPGLPSLSERIVSLLTSARSSSSSSASSSSSSASASSSSSTTTSSSSSSTSRVRIPPAVLDSSRNFDHGVFIPLLLMFPDATIPVVQVSISSDLSAETHLQIGEALSPLLDEGVLLVGSGQATHGRSSPGLQLKFAAAIDAVIRARDAAQSDKNKLNEADDDDNVLQPLPPTVIASLAASSAAYTPEAEKRRTALLNWAQLPGAMAAHGRAEHLMPLFVTAGAARCSKALRVGNYRMEEIGMSLASYMWI